MKSISPCLSSRLGLFLLLGCLISACDSSTTSSTSEAEQQAMSMPSQNSQDSMELAETPVQDQSGAPIAAVMEHQLTAHNDVRNDPYYWLRDDERENTDVLDYLNAENAYTNAQMEPLTGLRETLFKEMSARLKPDDVSVPYRAENGWFGRRFVAGKDLPIHVWWPGQQGQWPEGEADVLLDENELGADHDFYQIGDFEVSPDGRWLAWAEDTLSRGIYQIRFRALKQDNVDVQASEVIEGVSDNLAFSDDGRYLFYLKLQDETLIPWQVWRHQLGTNPNDDVLVHQEDDATFFNALERSNDGRWIVINQSSTTTSEVSVIDAAAPESARRVIIPRQRGHEYQADFLGERVFILTNENAVNFRLVSVDLDQAHDRSQWQELLAQRADALLQSLLVLKNHVIVEEVSDASQRLRVLPLRDGDSFNIGADEAAYVAELGANALSDTASLRYVYSSPTTPPTTYDINLLSGEKIARKQEFAGAEFDPQQYQTTRLNITARDGTAVPVTLLHRRGIEPDSSHPLFLLGYGSYGFSYLPDFNSQLFSLVDRGFVAGIAHIRGGQEKGRQWYEDGKLLNKKNTFTDFIDAAAELVKLGWAHPEKVVGSGRSAGGLLIGAVANMAPSQFAVLLAGVPFVDVITTMLDESIPLTTYEYDEWGNPNDKAYYDYMLSYSPYDNVHSGPYPHLLITTGLWDPAVQYWEPAKWIAKLRASKKDDRALLMYTDMTAGHRGGSGRFDRLRDRAMEYAFVMDKLGITQK